MNIVSTVAARRLLVLAVSAVLLNPVSVQAAKSCAEDPRLVAPCFSVRGRLSVYNGTPSQRIWVVGTHRILGVSENRYAPDGYDFLPSNMPRPIDPQAFYFGDFTVCPFTKDVPGVMRLVCVQSVDRLKAVK